MAEHASGMLSSVAESSMKFLFPQEVHFDDAQGLAQAVDFVSHRRGGLIVPFTHLDTRDGPAVVKTLRDQRQFSSVPIVMPIEYGLYHDMRRLYDWAAANKGIKFMPIVTPQTQRIRRGVIGGSGLNAYMRVATDTLKNGGIVALAPQGMGNTGTLSNIDSGIALRGLLDIAKRRGVSEYRVLPMAMYYPDVARKSGDMRGYHPGKLLQVNIGSCYTPQDVHQAAQRGYSADEWVFQRFARLLPERYR